MSNPLPALGVLGVVVNGGQLQNRRHLFSEKAAGVASSSHGVDYDLVSALPLKGVGHGLRAETLDYCQMREA